MVGLRPMLLAVLLCLPAWAAGQNARYQRYIETYKDMAVEQMLLHGVPASITLAQGLLESGAGSSTLAVKANNHFGIKCGGTWSGPYMLRDDDERNEKFRVYESPRQSYEDHSLFLKSRPRYAGLFALRRTDYKGWARGLKQAGYATNPRYADNLIALIETYGLDRYDHVKRMPARGNDAALNATSILPSQAASGGRGDELRIRRCNGNYYVVARAGDTFASLAREMGVSERRLRKYNEMGRRQQLQAGDVVFMEKKRKKAAASLKGRYHTVAAGESMHSIAQTYAVRMKTLYELNGLDARRAVRVGDRLLLRK